MQAGSLDRRVEILRATTTQNDINEDVPSWPVLATRWASKQDVSDGEKAASGTILASLVSRFQMRRDSVTATITPKDRLRYAGRTYDVGGVKDVDGREGVEITATVRADL